MRIIMPKLLPGQPFKKVEPNGCWNCCFFVIVNSDATYCRVFLYMSHLCPLAREGTTSSASWKLPLHQQTVHSKPLPSSADMHISKTLNVIIWSEAYRVSMPSPCLKWLTFCPIGRSAEEDQVQLWESYFVLSQLMKNLLVSTTDILILTHPAHKRSLW